MTKIIAMASLVLVVLVVAVRVDAWLPHRTTTPSGRSSRSMTMTLTRAASSQKATLDSSSESNPCWEDLYDDDCVMENAAAAGFVAAQWIKSMPCGEGIADCDMPDDLKVPETRPEAGIDHVDVMSMLGVKRAESIDTNK